MKTATLVRTLDADPERNGVKALYRMEPPHEGHEYVVASGVRWSYNGQEMAHECYLFGADAFGGVSEWSELTGSIRNTTDHAKAMGEAGYEIVRASR
jgi:hypothetical protein